MTTTRTKLRVHSALALALAAFGCSPASAPEPVTTQQRDPAPLSLGALHELVPAAGLRWMVLGQPRKISENADLRASAHELLPPERLEGFAQATAVDLTSLPHAAAAGFDMGTLYLAELPERSGHHVLERFVDRVAGRAVMERPHPRVTRVSGTVDGIPHGFVDLDGRVVAVSIADLTLSRVAAGFATGKLQKATPALRGAALSTLPAQDATSELTFYAPGPFEGEWARAGGGLLAATLAVAIRVEPTADAFLRATMTLAGEWEPGGEEAARVLELAFRELAASPTGKLFALDQAREVKTSAHPQYLTLSAELPLALLVRGLRAAVIADVWEMLDLPPPQTGARQKQ